VTATPIHDFFGITGRELPDQLAAKKGRGVKAFCLSTDIHPDDYLI